MFGTEVQRLMDEYHEETGLFITGISIRKVSDTPGVVVASVIDDVRAEI